MDQESVSALWQYTNSAAVLYKRQHYIKVEKANKEQVIYFNVVKAYENYYICNGQRNSVNVARSSWHRKMFQLIQILWFYMNVVFQNLGIFTEMTISI